MKKQYTAKEFFYNTCFKDYAEIAAPRKISARKMTFKLMLILVMCFNVYLTVELFYDLKENGGFDPAKIGYVMLCFKSFCGLLFLAFNYHLSKHIVHYIVYGKLNIKYTTDAGPR